MDSIWKDKERGRKVFPSRLREVLCVYPYRREKIHTNFLPPLGLEHIAAVVSPYAKKTTVIDIRYEPYPISRFINANTDLILLSLNWRNERSFFLNFINRLPKHIVKIVGGRYATEAVEELFEWCPNIHAVVRGDGEEPMRRIIENKGFTNVPCVSYRQNGRVIHNPSEALPPVRDDIFPIRKLRRYKYTICPGGIETGVKIDMVASSRGCPYRCKFCTFNMNPLGQKRDWSARSPESVVEELKQIDADIIAFSDDNFTHDMDRVGRICDLLLKERIKKRYIFNARVEIAKRPDVLAKMYKAGMRVPLIGLESCSDTTLRQLAKGFTTDDVRRYFSVLRRFGFFLHTCFIVGNIGETEEEILRIPKFARELGADGLSVQRLRVEKFSPLKELVEKTEGYHIREGEMGIVYSDSLSPQRLKRIGRKVMRRFYLPFHIFSVAHKLYRSGIGKPRVLVAAVADMVTRWLPNRKSRVALRMRSLHKLKANNLAFEDSSR
ncbi:MAG: B12-binding domain-containing radical SAM protein [Planctomycetota bacterium]|nr:B12-binding domain-containing radical SAM protein [Planctomycetota bacterium]